MKLFGHRNSIRLQKYDYSDVDWYFVTICVQNRQCLFGEIIDKKMILNNSGIMIKQLWNEMPKRFNIIELNIFQIMPNHVHGIIQIVGAGFMPALKSKLPPQNLKYINYQRATTRVAPTVGDFIGAFKSLTTHEYIVGVKNNGWSLFNKRLWQRNYYEHIIRNEQELNRIRKYIRDNPGNWKTDRNNLSNQ